MIRSSIVAACAAAVSLLAAPAIAQTAQNPQKPQNPQKADAKPAAKKAQPPSRTTVKTEPKGMVVTADSVETLSAGQLEAAQRVMTGTAECEFDQKVSVQAIDGRPGFFKVGFKNANYTMVPQETTTGAVRLEDRKAGIVWLQIPAKSMLMNSKVGQRMVDGCMQKEQKAL